MLCRDYCISMVGVMSFSKDKHEKFCRCPKCKAETIHVKLNDSELSFGEYLHKELNKKGYNGNGHSRKTRVVL